MRKGRGDGVFERLVLLCPRGYRLRSAQRRSDRRPPPARHARLLQQHLRNGPQMVRGAGPVFQRPAVHPRHPILPYGVLPGGQAIRPEPDHRIYRLFGERLQKEVRSRPDGGGGETFYRGREALAGGPRYGDEQAGAALAPSTPSSTSP